MKRKGANRTVILVGPWALKFPTLNSWRDFLFGLLNNQTEARVGGPATFDSPGVLASYGKGLRRAGVCPVLWACPGGFLVVMPRVPTFTRAGWVTFDYERWAQVYGVCVERKPCSFGLYRGNIVAVDYGWDN